MYLSVFKVSGFNPGKLINGIASCKFNISFVIIKESFFMTHIFCAQPYKPQDMCLFAFRPTKQSPQRYTHLITRKYLGCQGTTRRFSHRLLLLAVVDFYQKKKKKSVRGCVCFGSTWTSARSGVKAAAPRGWRHWRQKNQTLAWKFSELSMDLLFL